MTLLHVLLSAAVATVVAMVMAWRRARRRYRQMASGYQILHAYALSSLEDVSSSSLRFVREGRDHASFVEGIREARRRAGETLTEGTIHALEKAFGEEDGALHALDLANLREDIARRTAASSVKAEADADSSQIPRIA